MGRSRAPSPRAARASWRATQTESMSEFKTVAGLPGVEEALPPATARCERRASIVRDWLASYGYQTLRAPALEHTRLFARGIGDVTDFVGKEMYSFVDPLNDERLTMRPEFTAGIVR